MKQWHPYCFGQMGEFVIRSPPHPHIPCTRYLGQIDCQTSSTTDSNSRKFHTRVGPNFSISRQLQQTHLADPKVPFQNDRHLGTEKSLIIPGTEPLALNIGEAIVTMLIPTGQVVAIHRRNMTARRVVTVNAVTDGVACFEQQSAQMQPPNI